MATIKKEIKNKPININYDKDVDVLYISFGKPKPAISIEVSDGNFVRVDAYTDKVVGITIIDFKEKYMTSSKSNVNKSAQNVIPQIIEEFRKLH